MQIENHQKSMFFECLQNIPNLKTCIALINLYSKHKPNIYGQQFWMYSIQFCKKRIISLEDHKYITLVFLIYLQSNQLSFDCQ
ncbi:unnamed protein product (macronuclear) [Paramecium tetraurelia]|uniref:Uncharacterized protein n=1 Tax=Paramecium tetraurelia TaxID=5888 RepID=A0CRW8_PARTE|nr:uncharacterized protein GSPATT00038885001 [Paramecium tetraurelia]CAK73535.1 unnamed protein product [Paramecium tetraurelia]|eukprot:XP_001440932.1 hypothetical protein (macronuclear) [Paramecium tetraurelia strain d4-2]